MVLAVQLENKTIMSHFDNLSTQIVALLANPEITSRKQPARGPGKSGDTPWQAGAAGSMERTSATCIGHSQWNHPLGRVLTQLRMKQSQTQVSQFSGVTQWKKGATTIPFVLQKLDGFSQDDNMDLKMELLCQFIMDQEVNIFAFTKANTCWDLLPPKHRLPEHMHGWWENSHWSLGYNWVKTQTSTYRLGRTGVLVVNQLSHRL